MDWANLPAINNASGKKFNQVLAVTDCGSKQVILIRCWWKDKTPQVAEQFFY